MEAEAVVFLVCASAPSRKQPLGCIMTMQEPDTAVTSVAKGWRSGQTGNQREEHRLEIVKAIDGYRINQNLDGTTTFAFCFL